MQTKPCGLLVQPIAALVHPEQESVTSQSVFFIVKQLLLALDTPRKDFEFCRIFAELFIFVIDHPLYSPPAGQDSLLYSQPGS
jgi:hypothetical protein